MDLCIFSRLWSRKDLDGEEVAELRVGGVLSQYIYLFKCIGSCCVIVEVVALKMLRHKCRSYEA